MENDLRCRFHRRGDTQDQRERGVQTRTYKVWYDMLLRCYSDKHPAYAGCTVCEEWYNFQNFANWFTSQGNYNSKGFDLDKDLTSLGNRVYCPEYCELVPEQINKALISYGKRPKGVHWCVRDNKFIASIRKNGKKIRLGCFDMEEDAIKCYQENKCSHLKYLAEKFRPLISEVIYNNLSNWRFKYYDSCI